MHQVMAVIPKSSAVIIIYIMGVYGELRYGLL
jgi:hypothetical protein